MSNRDEDLIEEGREFTDEELEQYFREAEEEGPAPQPWIASPAFRRGVLIVIGLVMVLQVAAWWPQIMSLDAIRFLQVSARLSQSEEIQEMKRSIVNVRTGDSSGTGFIISEDGLIVTNRHVVEDAAHVYVNLPDDQRRTAEVIAISDVVDLALLSIEASQLSVLPLAERYTGEAALPIYLIGNPLFFSGIANEGETLGYTDTYPPIMVLDAPVYKGNSGSPVIDRNGKVIGVVYATSRITVAGQSMKVGLAVPVEWVHAILAEQGLSL